MRSEFSRRPAFGSILLLGLSFCVALTLALSPIKVSAQGGPPPIIDRELFFGDPEISGAQISPDGKFIAFIKPFKGTRNVWVKRTEDPFDKAKPITADTTRPIPAYFWSRDGKYILFVQDKAGDENYLVYAVNPDDPPARRSGGPRGAQSDGRERCARRDLRHAKERTGRHLCWAK